MHTRVNVYTQCRIQLWSWSSFFHFGIEQSEVNFSLPSINEVRWRNSGIVDPLNFCYLATYLSVDGGNIKESTIDLSQFGANSFYMVWKLCA